LIGVSKVDPPDIGREAGHRRRRLRCAGELDGARARPGEREKPRADGGERAADEGVAAQAERVERRGARDQVLDGEHVQQVGDGPPPSARPERRAAAHGIELMAAAFTPGRVAFTLPAETTWRNEPSRLAPICW